MDEQLNRIICFAEPISGTWGRFDKIAAIARRAQRELEAK